VSNRLNGWQRLWVVLSALWLVVVVGFTVFLWPTSKTMWHRDEFIRRMPADARAHVAASYSSKWQAREDRSGVHQLLPNDAELTVLELRRDKTRSLKQGMMQELLTGRTRLV